MNVKNYKITTKSFDPEKLNFNESIFTISNSYMGLRGIEDECPVGSYAGFFIAGLFDKSESLVPEIVNFPNIVALWFEVDNERFSPDTSHILKYNRELDMYAGTLSRSVVFENVSGKQILVESRRFLSFYDKNCGAINVRVTPLNFSGVVQLVTYFDGSILSSAGSYLYSEKVKHYNLININDQFEQQFASKIKLRDSGITVNFTSLVSSTNRLCQKHRREIYGERVVERIEFDLEQGQMCEINKFFCVCDSRLIKENKLDDVCNAKIDRMKLSGFEDELQKSIAILSQKWQIADVKIQGKDDDDLKLRFNIYQLIGLGSEDSCDFAIGAKGLSTEQYGGHYFWDTETYLLPFYLFANPCVAKNLLKFRYKTLPQAKERASSQGFDGCLWPWQSTADGQEGIRNTVTEDGVIKRREILDQYHIVSDVAFACFRYKQISGDEKFFSELLSSIMVESLRFWRSFIFKQNHRQAAQYHLKNVMGPDEYHPCVDDNYYTNYLTRWVFCAFLAYLKECTAKVRYDIMMRNDLCANDLADFEEIAAKIYLPQNRNGLIEQFDGFFKLSDQNVTMYDHNGLPRYPDQSVGVNLPDAERQDAIQKHAATTQLTKQADVVLLFAVLSNEFDCEIISQAFDYYLSRSLHFSSLSPGTYAVAGAICGRTEDAYNAFKLAVAMDLNDIKAETKTGLHTACHGASYMAVVIGFAGIRPFNEYLEICPKLPAEWDSVQCNVNYRGALIGVKVSKASTSVRLMNNSEVKVKYGNKIYELSGNTEILLSN